MKQNAYDIVFSCQELSLSNAKREALKTEINSIFKDKEGREDKALIEELKKHSACKLSSMVGFICA